MRFWKTAFLQQICVCLVPSTSITSEVPSARRRHGPPIHNGGRQIPPQPFDPRRKYAPAKCSAASVPRVAFYFKGPCTIPCGPSSPEFPPRPPLPATVVMIPVAASSPPLLVMTFRRYRGWRGCQPRESRLACGNVLCPGRLRQNFHLRYWQQPHPCDRTACPISRTSRPFDPVSFAILRLFQQHA